MPEYQDEEVITAVDRAYEALMMKDADNKAENARQFECRYHGSFAATIYRGQDENGDAFDWVLSWYNPRNDTRNSNNSVYTEIRKADQFKGLNWSSIHDNVWRKLTNADHHYSSATLNGCYSTVITGYSDVIDSYNRISLIF
ncbi:hypothetical protein FEM48_Zijuj11G0155300 [Ziziphus jujuba var. spinosa]|uniref:Uncharacterized protein n=1 Tax=Ziziphus jujuba var. spinosa TaxID=714518 RepID=A0A978UJS3_ZIZJJ|nr:hypothetical protein FEM48_Zijuj11G0155300 [Ziziphus jujuba var. spinosa]